MKKQLLTTTALVAAGVLVLSGGAVADKMKKPSLKISGGFEQSIGIQSKDGADDVVKTQQDGEIHFTASVELDNGMTVSGHSQLEVDNDHGEGGAAEIDESYMTVKGSFGQINIGATDGASYKMVYGYLGHAATGAGILNLAFDGGLTGNSAHNGRGLPRLTNDDHALVYFTPRISGLQAGVSYAQNDANNNKGTASLEDVVAAAVNYNGKFGDAGVGAALGYVTGNGDPGRSSYDTTVVSGGVKVTMGGFTAAAGFVRNTQDGNMAAEDHTRSDVGLRYRFGPNAVRVGYLTHSNDEKESAGTIATFARTLGPGVTWSLDAMIHEVETGGEETSGSYFGTGIAIKF